MDRPFVIRRLRASDAAGFRELRLAGLQSNPESFGASFECETNEPLVWFEDKLTRNIVLAGFSDADRMLGMAALALRDLPKNDHKADLWGMYVRPEARGLGLARNLVAGLIALAPKSVEEILLRVVTSNTTAVQLYTGLGFKQFGIERRALKTGRRYYDEMLMSFRLRDP